jgi:copper homeostasis protein
MTTEQPEKKTMKLEIIGFNLESCIAAQAAGADRIELCAGPCEGGVTPSYAFIKAAREKLQIDLYVMIRPREGDFLYDEDEFEMMKADIAICKELGCDGIVTGILTKDGNVDIKRCGELIELAYPMEATFHRAFDRVKNAFKALEDIINLGFERILTSGLRPKAMEGKNILADLVKQSDDRIIIMPGSGVTPENIIEIASATGAKEFHSSASKYVNSRMDYLNDQMAESLQYVSVDVEKVKQMSGLLKQLSNNKTSSQE